MNGFIQQSYHIMTENFLEVCKTTDQVNNQSVTIKLYGKCSKILNTRCLSKRPIQTVQSHIRLLHQKQSDLALHCLLF